MIGRGTRLALNLGCVDCINGEQIGKKYFIIFDYCGDFEYIRQNKDYIVNVAGSRVCFIRYEGIEVKVGAEMNVIKDKMFGGRIFDLVEQNMEYVRTQIKEDDGRLRYILL